MNKDKKIMLLYGGISAEREISIITSKEISKSLKNMGYNIVEIDANENLLADLELHVSGIIIIYLLSKCRVLNWKCCSANSSEREKIFLQDAHE